MINTVERIHQIARTFEKPKVYQPDPGDPALVEHEEEIYNDELKMIHLMKWRKKRL